MYIVQNCLTLNHNDVTQANFPGTIQLGDITDLKDCDLPTADLLIGGSPCQGFSNAGKGLNFEDPRSKLFFEFLKLRDRLKPKYWLLENVPMKKKWEDIISSYMGCRPVAINSQLVSAQHRNRLYWTNIRTRQQGIFGVRYTDIPQPEDRGIYLFDILEGGYTDRDKSLAVTPSVYHRASVDEYFKKSHHQLVFDDGGLDKYYLSGSQQKKLVEYIRTNKVVVNPFKASCLNACASFGSNGTTVVSDDYDVSDAAVARMIRRADKGIYPKINSKKSGSVTTDNSSSRMCIDGSTTFVAERYVRQLNPSKESGDRQPYQHNRVFDIFGLSPAITTDHRSPAIIQNMRLRRLTPKECERLQTVPDNYTDIGITDAKRYHMLGNGMTCDVITHILSFGSWT